MLKILGYPDRYSVAPGEEIAFKVSLEEGTHFESRVVRVVHGDANPAGPGLKFRHVPTGADGRRAGKPQRIDAGSYMIVESASALAERPFTFFAMVWPTLPERDDQTLLAQWDPKTNRGFRIWLSLGRLAVSVGDGRKIVSVWTSAKMLVRQWYSVVVAIDPAARSVTFDQVPIGRYAQTDDRVHLEATLEIAPPPVESPITLAGCPQADGTVGGHFDGKIDGPMLCEGVRPADLHRALLEADPVTNAPKIIARWDFSREIETTRAVDLGPSQLHGALKQLPTRAMKGWNWTGEEHNWQRKPEHYGAIHFHHDDVSDAGWETSVAITIPEDMPSGPYALHVTCGESGPEATRESYIAFFVRPPRLSTPRVNGARRTRPDVAVLAPTCSYLAYANHAEHITARGAELVMGRLLQFGHIDLYMYDHPELGGSLYDRHLDGSGVAYTSRLRPNLNCAPCYHSWLGGHGSALYQYNADTHLFDWLDHQGVDYDLITDEDLHEDGLDLIRDYRVILTGTHPEYHSTPMWDAMKAWIDRGGRLMYLGANGWYWRIAFHQTLPGVFELRRAEDGIRTWEAEPGEYYHSFNGEYGGLWRRIGRAPNVMAGVGFIAQGFDLSSYYRRAPDAGNPRAAFIFDGVKDEIIGDFGLIGGGAAGIELDCINTALGSPPNTLRLASSENHTPLILLVNEEFGVVPPNPGGDLNPRVKADMAFFETPAGGAVFSTASIAWCGSLSHNGYQNNVSRITGNVLRRFRDPKPFPTG
jgi:N,N-dimethylformamidase